MRRLLVPIALWLLLPAAVADAAPKVTCGPVRAKTLAEGRKARVYRSDGRTWVCAKGSRPVRVSRQRPSLARVTGTAALLVGAGEARSVDARSGRRLRGIHAPSAKEIMAVLRPGGAFAVQFDETIVKADADWPHRQVLTRSALPLSLERWPGPVKIAWELPEGRVYGAAYLTDAVARCDRYALRTDGGFTVGQYGEQVVMCPIGRPERTKLVFDGAADPPEPGETRYRLLDFRAGTAVVDVSRADRLSELSGGVAVLRWDRPARPARYATRDVGTGGPAVERVLLDPQGRAVLGLRTSYGADEPVPDASVYVVTASGERRLDSGPGVDAASLTLTGSVATWNRDGVPQTFDLAGA